MPAIELDRSTDAWQLHRKPSEVQNLAEHTTESERTNSELECLIDYRSRLLSRLAHELRNPLTSILGFAEILLNYEELSESQRDFCQKIQNSALQIESNLSLLSDLARLEAGTTGLSLEEFSLADALRETFVVLGRQAQKQNAALEWHADNDMPAIVSDRSKLRQVLYNFTAHAISRSPEGAAVTAFAARRGESFIVKIQDEGEFSPNSAQAFVDGKMLSLNQSMPTAELGLAIARQLMDVLGAKVSLASRKPRGLEVAIEIPARPRCSS